MCSLWRRNSAKFKPDLEKVLEAAVCALASAGECETSGLDTEAVNLFKPSIVETEKILVAVLGMRVKKAIER